MTAKSLAEKFWPKVKVTSDCWLWTGARNPSGYGILSAIGERGQRTTVGAHRIAYELLVGPIPEGLEIDHLCSVRHCVNPTHLEAVSRQENMRRGRRANQTHCKRGHPLEGDNLYVTNRETMQRQCRTCRNLLSRSYQEERRARLWTGHAALYRRLDIFDRDDFTCQLCGELIDMMLKNPHPESACIDHIIPVRRGGTDEPGNVQAAHRRCNSAKGRRLPGEKSG
jgi:5-methylcytosine-specific restriction endonuclease McrA